MSDGFSFGSWHATPLATVLFRPLSRSRHVHRMPYLSAVLWSGEPLFLGGAARLAAAGGWSEQWPALQWLAPGSGAPR